MYDDETPPEYTLWRALGERRYREEVAGRESQIRAELVAVVRQRIANEFWADLPEDQVLAGANFGPAFNSMAEAAVDALALYYRTQLNPT